MNPVLAQIYGTGFEKAASADDELDLNNISAAQLLELLEEGEKTASEDELDLSELTGAELLQLLDEADEIESEKTASVLFEKMAHDGSFDFYDAAGRIMAHAYADEFSKLASAEDDDMIEVDLDNISGEDLLELMDMGYEFDDAEKTAAPAKGVTSRIGAAVTDRVGFLRRMKGKRQGEAAKAVREKWFKRARKGYRGRAEHGGLPEPKAKMVKSETDRASLGVQRRAAEMRGSQFDRNVGRGVIAGGLGAAGLGTAGTVYGVSRMRKKKK